MQVTASDNIFISNLYTFNMFPFCMKTIEISDLINNDKIENTNFVAHKSIDLPEKKQPTPQISFFENFFEIAPQNELEKCMQKVLSKKDYKQKTRQNVIQAQFDSKMRRINKIKSKTYRKMRRKEKIVDNLAEDENISLHPGEMMAKYEDDTRERDNARDDAAIEGIKCKSKLVNKLLQKTKPAIAENKNVLSFDGEKKENYEKQKEIVKEMFKECDNEFENEFTNEKKSIIEAEMPSIEKEVLPGWNSWGGAGLEVIETKYNTVIRRKEGIDLYNRKDHKQSNVIINENNKPLDDKYIATLPFGYTKEDYEMKMNMPVTKEWNSLRVFNKLVRNESKKNEQEIFEYESKYI